MSFYTDVLKKDPRFNSTGKINDLALLEPGFRAKVAKFIALAAAQGHVVHVIETYRSQARQQQLFAQHATELRHVGVHGFGLAVDLALYINGVYDPKGQDYAFFKALAKESGVISGIDWGEPCQKHSFQDSDHLQGVPVFRQPALFDGTWYPEAGYDPWDDERQHHVTGA